MSDAPPGRPAAVLRAGSHVLPVEADRIYVIGSGENADLRIRHDSVAPYHATFSAHAGSLRIEDLGSDHGTFVGEILLRGAAEVPPGTRVRLGAIEIEVEPPGVGLVTTHAAPPTSGFAELMGEELRHAPWFAASLLLHVLIFVLLWMLLDDVRFGQPGRRLAAVIAPAQESTDDFDPSTPEAEQFEVEMEAQELELQELELLAMRDESREESLDFDEPMGFAPDAFGGTSMFQRIGGGSGGPDVLQSIGGSNGGGFRRTVEGLRESGLEIVFVFDSTGSMGPVLQATKARMTRMLEALVALVPDARVGVVTYRDDGKREEYLTRTVPLARDLYRAINFMQTVQAAGGGDRPEAVFEALQAATKQRWRSGARRVVVLVGDAPAHEESTRDMERLLRNFTRNGHSFVHAITTSPDVMGAIDPNTRKSFERIAKSGKGVCLPFEREESILRQVLTLAIGQDFREEIDRVYDLLEKRDIPVSRSVQNAVDTADGARIQTLMSRPTVPPELMQALIASHSLAIAEILIDGLLGTRWPEHSRQAAAFALQQLLDLPGPPVDVERGARLSPEGAEQLRSLARRHLR